MFPEYQKENVRIKKSIEKELHDNGLSEFFIQNRVKSQESIQKKNKRKDEFNQDIEITDYSGIRLILVRLFEMRICIELITKKFEVDYINSNFNQQSFIEDNQFGYLSSHIVVKENNIKTEIQIRTLSQHLWASISHSLDYKSIKKDTIFRRKLFRLSSLLEQVDISIEDLYVNAPNISCSNLKSLGKLDHYSLEFFLSRKEKLFALIAYSVKNKRKLTKKKQNNDLDFNQKYDISLRILDGSDSDGTFALELILITCEKLEINNIEDLKYFLENKTKYVREIRDAFTLSDTSILSNMSNAFKIFLFLLVFISKADAEYILKRMKLSHNLDKKIIDFTEIFKESIN